MARSGFGQQFAPKGLLDEVAIRRAELVVQLATAVRSVRQVLSTAGGELAPQERVTLEVGSWVVLGAMGLGLQVGRWSAWSVLIALGGYLAWVVIYSEATVQASHWRARVADAMSEKAASPAGDE